MVKKIVYPRTCVCCNAEYKHPSSYFRHFSSGACEKKVESNNTNVTVTDINNSSVTTNTNSNNSTTININLVNNNDLTNSEVGERIERILNTKPLENVKELLEENNIRGGIETLHHIRNSVSSLHNIKQILNANSVDEIMDTNLQRLLEESVGKSPTHPLHILFRKIFIHVNGRFTLKSLSRHVIRKNKSEDDNCSTLDFAEYQDSEASRTRIYIFWAHKQWHSLICELIFALGNCLMRAYIRKNKITIDKSKDLRAYKNRFKNVFTPFAIWWSQIDREEDISLSKEGKFLISELKQEIIDDCKRDTVNGWHSLIECCSLFGENNKTFEEKQKMKKKDRIEELRKAIAKVIG